MPGPKDIEAAYKPFQHQHPRPRPNEHDAPNGSDTQREERTPLGEGWTPPTILLLAPHGHKHATRTVQRHHTPWSIPKHNAPETNVPPVREDDQGIPRTYWHCGPAAPDTPWPLLHLISTNYHIPTAATTADHQAWLSPWFHTVPSGHPAHVAWSGTPTAEWTFTSELADPESVAIEYDRCDPHRAGPHEAPMRPLQHKCSTRCGDKEERERRQTITCQRFQPKTGYLFRLMYAYITQGRPDRGLICLIQRAQAIITQGIGVYATPLLQPTQTTIRTATRKPLIHLSPDSNCLPVPSDTDIIFFTDASGTQQRSPTISVRMDSTWSTTPAGAVIATLPPTTNRPRNIWVVVDATVHIRPTKRLAELPLHRALESGLTTQGLRLWMAFRGMHPGDALHIVKQESHRYTYGNGRADTHAKQQNTNHTPGLEHVRLDTTHHSHLQHLPRIPSATQSPHWIPEDTPYLDRDKQYHYPTPIQQLATTPRRLEDSLRTLLYYSALRPNSLPADLQKTGLQLALEHLPLLTQYYRWYARRSNHVPAGYTKCICGDTEDKTCNHFKICPLYRGLDTVTDWKPTHTISQHTGLPTPSPATQKIATIVRQTEVLEAVGRGLIPTAVYTLLRIHADDPKTTAAHMQRTAVVKTAEQLAYRPTNTCSMQPPYPQQTRATSSNSCSINHETPPSDLPADAGPSPPPSPRTIHHTRHQHSTQEHHRHRTHTQQHMHTTSPHAPMPPSVHRYRQPPATACPLCVRQRIPLTALPWNPNHWVCLGAAHPLTNCPHCRDPKPYHRAQFATTAAPPPPPPASHPNFFGPLIEILRDYLGGHYGADPADHVSTIAMATGDAFLPLHSPPLRNSGGGLNVAARHILLALYLHHRGLHLPNPQPPAPRARAPATEAWAQMAPEEVADYLRRTCRRFNTDFGRQKETPYPLSALPYRAAPPSHTAEAPGVLGVLS